MRGFFYCRLRWFKSSILGDLEETTVVYYALRGLWPRSIIISPLAIINYDKTSFFLNINIAAPANPTICNTNMPADFNTLP